MLSSDRGPCCDFREKRMLTLVMLELTCASLRTQTLKQVQGDRLSIAKSEHYRKSRYSPARLLTTPTSCLAQAMPLSPRNYY